MILICSALNVTKAISSKTEFASKEIPTVSPGTKQVTALNAELPTWFRWAQVAFLKYQDVQATQLKDASNVKLPIVSSTVSVE